MDLLRRATGERRLTYVGGSYGTFLGATYANLFPGRIRAMVLSSAIDPKAWVNDARRTRQALAPTYVRQRTDVGTRMTLDAFLTFCGRTSTARCAFSAGSAAATRAKFAALLRRLPRSGSPGSATYAAVDGVVTNELYAATGWGELAKRLQHLWTTGSTGAGIPDQFPGIGGTLAINCSDSPNPGPAAFSSAAAFAYRRSGAVGSLWTWATEPCATWPATAADPYRGPWNRRTANPVLVVGNTYDPGTPYHAAVALSKELGRARLLTVDGYGHGAPSACANRIMTRYLIKRIVPARGVRCAGPRPFTGGQ
jgi:pimeloyl-ACP methyl ester carboxylesterase